MWEWQLCWLLCYGGCLLQWMRDTGLAFLVVSLSLVPCLSTHARQLNKEDPVCGFGHCQWEAGSKTQPYLSSSGMWKILWVENFITPGLMTIISIPQKQPCLHWNLMPGNWILNLCSEGTWTETSLARHCERYSLRDSEVRTPVFTASLAVRSTPRAKWTCLLVFLDVRNAISPCLHFCCTNNRIIISLLCVWIN